MLVKEAVKDLKKVREDVDTIVESLELMSDEKFMSSHHMAKQQIKRKEFVDWHELQSTSD